MLSAAAIVAIDLMLVFIETWYILLCAPIVVIMMTVAPVTITALCLIPVIVSLAEHTAMSAVTFTSIAGGI